METLHRLNVTVRQIRSCVGACTAAAAALSADSTEKSSPFDQDYLSTQPWNNTFNYSDFLISVQSGNKWTKTSTFIICTHRTSLFLTAVVLSGF